MGSLPGQRNRKPKPLLAAVVVVVGRTQPTSDSNDLDRDLSDSTQHVLQAYDFNNDPPPHPKDPSVLKIVRRKNP